MEDIKRKFLENYLLGVIKFKGSYDFYLMPIAWWILNYEKYDPEYDPSKWQAEFRDNILNVTDSKIENFVKAIEVDKLNVEDLKSAIGAVPPEYTRIVFYVDLDNKIFVSGFHDIEAEEYLPDTSWKGIIGNPSEYLPEALKWILGNVSK